MCEGKEERSPGLVAADPLEPTGSFKPRWPQRVRLFVALGKLARFSLRARPDDVGPSRSPCHSGRLDLRVWPAPAVTKRDLVLEAPRGQGSALFALGRCDTDGLINHRRRPGLGLGAWLQKEQGVFYGVL